jgi:hypothetical protein
MEEANEVIRRTEPLGTVGPPFVWLDDEITDADRRWVAALRSCRRGGLDVGEDVDGPDAEFETSVKIRLDLGQSMPSTMRKSRSTPSERATNASR